MNFFTKASAHMSKLFSYKKYFSLLLAITSISVLFYACTTIQDTQSTATEFLSLNQSVHYYKHQNTREKLLYHLVTIQLDSPHLTITATQSAESKSAETQGETTEQFAKRTGSFVAINASPFSYTSNPFSRDRNIEGLYIFEGKTISQLNERYAALCFTREKQAFIVNSQIDQRIQDAYFAFGGFWTILEDDTIIQFNDIKDARTAVGVSKDGHTLYILIVEKNNKSTGLNYMDCAKILQNAGASKAIQLDGGGSTSLVFPDFPDITIRSMRKVANNIGFIIKD